MIMFGTMKKAGENLNTFWSSRHASVVLEGEFAIEIYSNYITVEIILMW